MKPRSELAAPSLPARAIFSGRVVARVPAWRDPSPFEIFAGKKTARSEFENDTDKMVFRLSFLTIRYHGDNIDGRDHHTILKYNGKALLMLVKKIFLVKLTVTFLLDYALFLDELEFRSG